MPGFLVTILAKDSDYRACQPDPGQHKESLPADRKSAREEAAPEDI